MAAPPAKFVDVVADAALPVTEILQVPEAPDPVVGTNAPPEPTLIAKAVATPVPSPVILPSGRFVALVRSIALGVPKAGVTSVGDVARTTLPVPVLDTHSGAVPLELTCNT